MAAGPSGDERATVGREAPQPEAVDHPAEAASATPPPSAYDDMLCTICGLKACWMTPEAAGKTGPSS
jgi:hypothetical protein